MKKMFNRSLIIAGLALAVIGCSSEEDTIIASPLPVVESEFTPTVQWTASIGDGVGQYFSKLTPAYAYDMVFVASRDGEVKALDPEDGDTIWSIDLGDDDPARLAGGITASYNKVFIASENGEVYALSTEDGSILWQENINGEVLSKPLADESLIMVHTTKGDLVALQQDTGSQAWTINNEVPNLTLRGDSDPVSTSGAVFWGMANGRIAAAMIEKGQLLWQRPVGVPQGSTEIDRIVDVDSSPLIVDASLFAVSSNGQLTGIDLRSGQFMWKRPYSAATDLATDGDKLFVVTEKDHISAVDLRSGTELWSNDELEYRQLTDPVILGGYLVTADSEGYLHWLDRFTGKFVAQQLIEEDGVAVSPIEVGDGYLIVTRDGDIKKMTYPDFY